MEQSTEHDGDRYKINLLWKKFVAVSADFEGMLMQIGIKDEDQSALRYLCSTKNGIKQY